jgi:hypothetical protein
VSLPTNSPLESESMKDMLEPPPLFVLDAPSASRASTWLSSSAMACQGERTLASTWRGEGWSKHGGGEQRAA